LVHICTEPETWKSAVSTGPGSRGHIEGTCTYKSCIHTYPSMEPIAVSSNHVALAPSTKHASCARISHGQPQPGCVVRAWLGTDVNQSDLECFSQPRIERCKTPALRDVKRHAPMQNREPWLHRRRPAAGRRWRPVAPSALSVLSLAEFKVEDKLLHCGARCRGVCLPLSSPRSPVGRHMTFGGAAGGLP